MWAREFRSTTKSPKQQRPLRTRRRSRLTPLLPIGKTWKTFLVDKLSCGPGWWMRAAAVCGRGNRSLTGRRRYSDYELRFRDGLENAFHDDSNEASRATLDRTLLMGLGYYPVRGKCYTPLPECRAVELGMRAGGAIWFQQLWKLHECLAKVLFVASSSSVNRSRTPNQFLGVPLHTIASNQLLVRPCPDLT